MTRSLNALVLIGVLTCSQPRAADVAPTGPTHVAQGASPAATDEVPLALEGKFPDAQRSFADVKDQLLKRYVGTEVTEDDLYRAALIGMLEYADPARRKWNKLLSPTEVSELMADLQGQFTGVGVKIGTFDSATGYSTVIGTIPGTGGERAGIQPDDIIVTVDGKLFRGKTERDVVHAVRGKAGEVVTLSILRGDQLLTVPIKRAMVQYDAVDHRVFAGGIGYAAIESFTSRTPDQLAAALTALAGQSVRSLILDLRGNQGGDFEKAVSCAEMMLPPGAVIATMVERGGKEKVFTSDSTAPRVLGDVPLYVLIDHETSSGAELVTAALKDSRHAQVLGTHTYGKWSVQTMEDLPNGYAVKYTTGLFQSPSHKSYEGTGLTPDVEVDMDSDLAKRGMAEMDPEKELTIDTQLRTAVNLLTLRALSR